jgi:hypothetical protein
MRVQIMGLWSRGLLTIEFVRDQLTSYGGLELLRHYFELSGLNRCIRHGLCEHDRGSD